MAAEGGLAAKLGVAGAGELKENWTEAGAGEIASNVVSDFDGGGEANEKIPGLALNVPVFLASVLDVTGGEVAGLVALSSFFTSDAVGFVTELAALVSGALEEALNEKENADDELLVVSVDSDGTPKEKPVSLGTGALLSDANENAVFFSDVFLDGWNDVLLPESNEKLGVTSPLNSNCATGAVNAGDASTACNENDRRDKEVK